MVSAMDGEWMDYSIALPFVEIKIAILLQFCNENLNAKWSPRVNLDKLKKW